MGKPLDRARYDLAVSTCALTSDIEMLPAGNDTEIGEKGINLSGGQKVRSPTQPLLGLALRSPTQPPPPPSRS